MPGVVKAVAVKVGDKVAAGQEVCVIGKFIYFMAIGTFGNISYATN